MKISGLDLVTLKSLVEGARLLKTAHEHQPVGEDGELDFDLPTPIVEDFEDGCYTLQGLSLAHFTVLLMGLDLLKWARWDGHYPELLEADEVVELSCTLKILIAKRLAELEGN